MYKTCTATLFGLLLLAGCPETADNPKSTEAVVDNSLAIAPAPETDSVEPEEFLIDADESTQRRISQVLTTLPESWDLEAMEKASLLGVSGGEGRVLFWNEEQGAAVMLCKGHAWKEKDIWRISIIRFSEKTWKLAFYHASYPEGHPLWPGFWHMCSEQWESPPTYQACTNYLKEHRVVWPIDAPANQTAPATWEWFSPLPAGKLPD